MRTVVGWVGRVLLTSGILLLLFVAYQLWGTGIYESRQQDQLSSQFDETAARNQAATSTTTLPGSLPGTLPGTTSGPTSTTRPVTPATVAPPAVPANGEPVAKIEIAKIGVSKTVVEGIDVPDLRMGPGRYPETVLPGEEGNVGIAGHRTTYGAPFSDLDQLSTGDEIVVTDLNNQRFTYKVAKDPFTVDPNAGEVLEPQQDPSRPGHFLATLTLTTCNPKFSAAERLIVQADLVLPAGAVPSPATVTPRNGAKATIAGLEGDTGSSAPTILWGLIAALVGGAWWFLFHRYKKWYVWIAGAIPFLVVLFVFFTYLERLLPSNY